MRRGRKNRVEAEDGFEGREDNMRWRRKEVHSAASRSKPPEGGAGRDR